jgi:hypothetical protein
MKSVVVSSSCFRLLLEQDSSRRASVDPDRLHVAQVLRRPDPRVRLPVPVVAADAAAGVRHSRRVRISLTRCRRSRA